MATNKISTVFEYVEASDLDLPHGTWPKEIQYAGRTWFYLDIKFSLGPDSELESVTYMDTDSLTRLVVFND